MENFDQLQKRMRLEYPDLSPRLQHLLSFAISHPQEMALETISEIAQKAQALEKAQESAEALEAYEAERTTKIQAITAQKEARTDLSLIHI